VYDQAIARRVSRTSCGDGYIGRAAKFGWPGDDAIGQPLWFWIGEGKIGRHWSRRCASD
jgi:hypothetical protein